MAGKATSNTPIDAEASRIEALKRLSILDTPPETTFDDLVRLLARLCRTSIAFLSFIDERRQWFKAQVGLPVSSLPRELALCTQTLHEPGVVVHTDLATDPRVADYPLVATPPRVRFYAAIALRTPEGHALGTLGIMDPQPRSGDPEQEELLETLRDQVMVQLDLRRQIQELARRASVPETLAEVTVPESVLLRHLVDNLPESLYVKDAQGRYLFDNRAHMEFIGAKSQTEVAGKTSHDFFPRGLAERYERDDHQVIQSGQPLLNRHEPIIDAVGRIRWVSTTKVPVRDARGEVRWVVGISRDITERKRAEEALAQERELLTTLMDRIPDHIYFKDRESRFIRINKACATWFKLNDPAEAVGRTDFDYFGKEHAQQAFDDEQKVMQSGRALVGSEERETWPDGHVTWVSTTKLPLRDKEGKIIGTFGISRDITERKVAEAKIALYANELRTKNLQLEEDLNMAREVQQAFLPQKYPSFPAQAGEAESALRFSHRYRPTEAVGGDFFDVLPLSDSQAGVFICDVMGKGVRAALVTAMVRTLVQELAQHAQDAGGFLTDINRELVTILKQAQMPMLVSACYVVADVARGRLQYARAGHPSPLRVARSDGTVAPLEIPAHRSDPVLGMLDEITYQTHECPLTAGDRILLFTDGLYEVEDAEQEEFGHERLVTAVRQLRDRPTEELLDSLLEAVQQFSPQRHFSDDVCLVAMEVARLLTR